MAEQKPQANTAPKKVVKPTGCKVAGVHYARNGSGSFVLHGKIELDGKPTASDVDGKQFVSRDELAAAITAWFDSTGLNPQHTERTAH